jgi:hypothetical protein
MILYITSVDPLHLGLFWNKTKGINRRKQAPSSRILKEKEGYAGPAPGAEGGIRCPDAERLLFSIALRF